MISSFDTAVATASFLVIVVAVASNAVLIVAMIVKKKINKKPFEMFLFSMAFSDVLFVFSTGLPFAVYKAEGTWRLGARVCQVYVVGRAAFEKISLFTIGFVGIESFRALKRVDGRAFSIATARGLIIGSWVTLLALACPYAAWYKLQTFEDGSVMCNVDFLNTVTGFYTVCSRALMFIPLLLVAMCYAGVIYRTVKSHRQVRDVSRSNTNGGQRGRRTVRTARTCILLAVIYLGCKLPFTLVLLHAQISRDTSQLRLAEVLWIISTANAATSPFLYGLLHLPKGLIGLCKSCCCKNDTTAPIPPHVTRDHGTGHTETRRTVQASVSGQYSSETDTDACPREKQQSDADARGEDKRVDENTRPGTSSTK